METGNLIKAIAADADSRGMPLGSAWGFAAACAVVIAAIAFFAMLGPRHDIGQAIQTLRFPFKFVVTLALAVSAFSVLVALSRPASDLGRRVPWLFVAPGLLLAAIAIELFVVPSSEWATRMVGHNSLLCLTFIPLIAIGPLAVFLATLRHGAPTRPRFTGAVAGLVAGGVAASLYAAHCPDDSPLFVAIWYTIAISGLALAGAILAPRVARW